MKKVVSTAMVAHLWANESQPEARNGNGTIFFQGRELFSYRRSFKIGEIVTAPNGETFYFINNNTYSNTTLKHESLAQSAVPNGANIVSVNMQDDTFGRIYGFSAANAHKSADYLSKWINEYLKLQTKARAYDYMTTIQRLYSHYQLICQAWDMGYYSLPSFPLYHEAMERLEKIKQKTKEEEARKQTELAKKKLAQLEKVAEWFTGKNVGDLSLIPVHLRLSADGEYIETTKGAKVPVMNALRVWDAIENGKPINGLKIGGFTCNSFDGENIQIGCHSIPFEIARKFMNELSVNA
jgi:hypothetical protein